MDSKVNPRSEDRLSPEPLGVGKPPTSGAMSTSASPQNLPAAQQVAEVVSTTLGHLVRLPPQFAKRAVEQWLVDAEADGDVMEGPAEASPDGPSLRPDEWAIRVRSSGFRLYVSEAHAVSYGRHRIHVFPKYTIILAPRGTAFLLRALEKVKPEEFDATGRPIPWIPPRTAVESPEDPTATQSDNENDIEIVRAAAQLNSDASEESSEPALITNGQILAEFESLARAAGFAQVPPLVLKRGLTPRDGFVSGLVSYTPEFSVVRVRLTTCPNADWADILTTAAHELAHPLSRTFDHGTAFKRTLVELAGRYWGESWFTEARRRIDEPYRTVDRWVTCGIRAALRNGEPPVAKQNDDAQLARVLTRIRKLRDLAEDQVGLPEGISANATANDLITTYGLEECHLGDGTEARDQMVDRWICFEDDAVWKRSLAGAIARFFDAFSLIRSSERRMHLFGK